MPTPFESMIEAHALREAPREACGFVMRDKEGVLYAQEEKNLHNAPEQCFAISPVSFLAAKNSGALVGIYHSQPGGPEPSPADRGNAAATSYPAFIYGVGTGTLSCYVAPEDRQPLLGRKFAPLLHDCVSLVWDHFALLGRPLPFLPRTQADYRNGTRFDWPALARAAGAVLVQSPMPNDILLMTTGSATRPNHLGVYLEHGVFIHQMADQPSRREVWQGFWQRSTTHIIRLAP